MNWLDADDGKLVWTYGDKVGKEKGRVTDEIIWWNKNSGTLSGGDSAAPIYSCVPDAEGRKELEQQWKVTEGCDESSLRIGLTVPYLSHDVNVRKKAHQSIRHRLSDMLDAPHGQLVQLCQRHWFLQFMQRRQRAAADARRASQAPAAAAAAAAEDPTAPAAPPPV